MITWGCGPAWRNGRASAKPGTGRGRWLMFQPSATAVEVFLQGDADDGGEGPVQYPGDIFTPSSVEGSYTVPTGKTLEVQQVGLQLVRPVTGESAWGAIK